MGARQVFALGSAALGALAALNSALSTPPPPEPPAYGSSQRYRWAKGEVHYTVSGSGSALLMIHGIGLASSSFEMRYILEPLARTFRVYALDLLGFGHSERPRLVYDADLYVTLIEDFIREVTGPTALIASGLSSAYALTVAAQEPDLVRALILSGPPPIAAQSGPLVALRPAADMLLGAPVVGQSLFHLLTARTGIRMYLREQAYSNRELVTESMVDTQYAMAHQPNARLTAQAYLAGRLHLDIDHALSAVRQPVLLVFGTDVHADVSTTAAAYVRGNPRAQVMLLDHCGVLPHEEQVERFVEATRSWFDC